ncbi:venom protease-like isoform X2 [Daktulosphaira vitifoliae]|nr:venom protease-like isoform X2 [Daktulosphaira vitifoliae]
MTPTKEAGECINIKRCPSLIHLLREKNNTSVITFLRNSTCGYENKDPKVCCPIKIEPSKNTEEIISSQNIYVHNNSDTVTTIKPKNPSNNSMLLFPNESLDSTCGHSDERTISRIVGGVPASLGDWPWIAAIGYRDIDKPSMSPKWMCGGALVSRKYVLTAAHCTVNIGKRKLSVIRLGDLNLDPEINDSSDPIDVLVDDIIHHELYNSANFFNDIALLKLNDSVEFNKFIQPICLPIDPQIRTMNFTTNLAYVAGWGALEFRGRSSNELFETQLYIVDNAMCNTAYNNLKATISENMLCAGTERKNACQGDSGGPLTLSIKNQYYLIGITSFGFKCVGSGYPGVFTRVTEYIEWIREKIH